MAEAIDGITDQAFAVNGRLPVYTRDGAARLQRFFRESTGTDDIVVTPSDVAVRARREGDRDTVGGCPESATPRAGRNRGLARARVVVQGSRGFGIVDGVRRAGDAAARALRAAARVRG